MPTGLHSLLLRQLRRLGLTAEEASADLAAWQQLLERVSRAYTDADQERYLLERSQEVSSREMQALYAQIEEAQRIAGLGNWSYDRLRHESSGSAECLRLIGSDPYAKLPTWRQLLGIVHHADRPALRRAIHAALREGHNFDIEFRLLPPSLPSTVWVRVRGEAVRDARGKVTRLHGTTTDISARKRVELRQALEYAVTRLLAEADDDAARMLNSTFSLLAESLEACAGTLWIPGPARVKLQACATDELPPAHVAADGDAPPPLVLEALRGEQVVHAAGSTGTDDAREAALLCIPLIGDSTCFGVMQFRVPGFKAGDLTLLRSIRFIGRLVAMNLSRRQTAKALRQSEAHFRALVEHASDSLFVHTPEGRIIDVNQRACDSLGYRRAELLALEMRDLDLWHDRHNREALDSRLRTGRPAAIESRFRRHDGTPFPAEISIAPLDIDGRPHLLSLVRDVTERVEMQARLQHLAYHDTLTGLPNRARFSQQLERAIARARRNHKRLALLFLDLDRFKVVNDTLGHEAGDELLQEMGKRLAACVRQTDLLLHTREESELVARFGGDEFIILVEDLDEPAQAAHVARKILQALVGECQIHGQSIHVTGSIGISLFPDDGDDGRTLMRRADAAMYRAKARGKDDFEFYSAQMDADSANQLLVENGLRSAIAQGELRLHYQPKVDLRTLRTTGVEALMRWQHPVQGLLPPARFIAVAEETGLIVPMTDWLIREAATQQIHWQQLGLPPLTMAINLSPRLFADDRLPERILDSVRQAGMTPQFLEIEITESMVMHDAERAIEMLARLRRAGVRVAMDDFGTGYSSLSLLGRFPINVLKIDRAFVTGLPDRRTDIAIARAIIAMGRGLGMGIVAEGVENAAQAEFLRQCDCEQAQGYHFSRPLPAEAFFAWYRTRHPSSP